LGESDVATACFATCRVRSPPCGVSVVTRIVAVTRSAWASSIDREGTFEVKLFLIRHGATEWSATGQHTGTTDLPLTSEGTAQLGPLARGLRHLVGDELTTALVFSSPRVRALVTAETVMGEGHVVCVDSNLAEFNYGDYEGLTTEEIWLRRPGWDMWRDGCPNGETAEDAGRRADAFLSVLDEAPDTVFAFAHGHIIRILAARAIGLEAHEGRIFALDTATVSVIEDVRGQKIIQHWNIDPAGL
jgi:broad specificity phosphatase PhoE